MPPAIVAVVALAATVAVQVFVESAIVAAILTLAINVAATMLMRRAGGRTAQGNEIRLKLDPALPRQIPLGRTATGGSMVYAFTYGSTSNVPNNAYLVRIIALSDLPVSGLVAVLEGSAQLTFTGNPTTGWVTCNQHRTPSNNPTMMLRVYLGSSSPTADANAVSWSGGQWSSSHKGKNMAYAVVRYQFDEDGVAYPNGEPALTFVLDGVKCYDDRLDGSKPDRVGSHRLDDVTTWEFTKNAGILTAQVLRGFYSNDVLILGVQAEERDLDDAMLLSAYNTCAESVTYSGGTQARYEAGMMASSGDPVANILQDLQGAMDGRIIDRAGYITILPGASRTPVFNLTDDDIVWSEEKSWQPKATLSELYNNVTGVYVDEESIFQERAFPPLRNATWETDDGGERLTLQLALPAITNDGRAQRVTKRIHQSSRYQGTVAFILPLWGIEMEQGDWFTLTSSRFGFSTKYFEAVTVDILPSMQVAVVGRETSPDIDGWDHVVDEVARTDTVGTPGEQTGLPVPSLVATAVKKIESTENVEVFGVKVTITGMGNSGGVANTIQLQIAPTSNEALATTLGTLNAQDQIAEFYGLLPTTAYSVRGRSSDGPRYSAWSDWEDVTTGSSSFGYTVVVASTLTVTSNPDGTFPSGTFPISIPVDVRKSGTSVRTSNSTSYSITNTNVSATINNTNGSSSKGNISLTAISGSVGYIDLSVTVDGIPSPVTRITINKYTPVSIPSGSGGTSSYSDNSLTQNITSSSYVAVTGVGTLTLTGTEDLVGSGLITYSVVYDSAPAHRKLLFKWQYSPAGAGTWTDFPSSPVSGSYAFSGDPSVGEPGYTGEVTVAQTQSGLAAGSYDVRLMARVDLVSHALNPSGNATMTVT
jgi:hypothetical protein